MFLGQCALCRTCATDRPLAQRKQTCGLLWFRSPETSRAFEASLNECLIEQISHAEGISPLGKVGSIKRCALLPHDPQDVIPLYVMWNRTHHLCLLEDGHPAQRSRPNGPRSVLSADLESSCWAPVQRLPQPTPRPRLPVRVASHRAWLVKAAQEDGEGGAGALVLALTAMLDLGNRTGGSFANQARVCTQQEVSLSPDGSRIC